MEEPRLIRGGLGIDDRGEVAFVNDFKFDTVKRFYTLKNHSPGFVRAWHGHKKESKYIYVAQGAALVCAVKIDDWENPGKELPLVRHVMTAKQPSVLYIPAGYANGTMSLEADTLVVVFSNSTLEESKGD